MADGNAAAPLQIDLLEFEKLRDEIDNRTELSKDILLAELTILGAGLSLVDKFPDVLGAVAGVSSFLWLFWLDHTEQIYKIASYIGTQLAPRLRNLHAGALQWESFLRKLDQGGTPMMTALFPGGQSPGKAALRKTRNIGKYVMLLFGFTAPVLLVAYFFQVLWPPLEGFCAFWARGRGGTFDKLGTVRCIFAVLVALLWGYGFTQYWKFRKTLNVIDSALLASIAAERALPPSEVGGVARPDAGGRRPAAE